MGAAEKLSSQAVADRLDELPTLPTIVYELSRVINDPMSSTSEVETIMANDQSLTTKVLRLANSAYYAIPGGVSNLKRAIAYIGYDAINQLVLSASIMEALDSEASPIFDPAQFWRHSLGVAMASETTAKYLRHKNPSDLFTCGLVHDMGKIALNIVAREDFNRVLEFAKEKNLSVMEAEMELDAARHTTIGRELAVKWRLPAIFQATTAYHHQKDLGARSSLSQEMHLMVDIVFLSNLLLHALQFGHSGHNKVLGVPKDLLVRLQISPDKLKELIAQVKTSLESAESFLSILGG